MESLTLFNVSLLLRPAYLRNTVTIQALPDLYGTCHPDKTLSLEASPLAQLIPPGRPGSGLLCLAVPLAPTEMALARLLFHTHLSHPSLSSASYLGGKPTS